MADYNGDSDWNSWAMVEGTYSGVYIHPSRE